VANQYTRRSTVSAIANRIRGTKERVLPLSTADKSEAKLERRRKKAAAEAQRREHQLHDPIHRK
jgi:hypothetical protein